jgi:hypothetical protein
MWFFCNRFTCTVEQGNFLFLPQPGRYHSHIPNVSSISSPSSNTTFSALLRQWVEEMHLVTENAHAGRWPG